MVGLAGAALALAAGSAYGGWRAGRAELDRVGVLERRMHAAELVSATLASERDRLKADRDRLETIIAAGTTPPVACPNRTVSTLDAPLTVPFIVEYPCGWSVLEQPMQRPPDGSPREGLMVDNLFFSPFPLSFRPTAGPVAEITLEAWSADPAGDRDLPAIEEWLSEARGRFTTPAERSVATRAGLPVTLIEGTIEVDGDERPAVLYVWTQTDAGGVRRIYEAFALDPSRTVRTALGSLVASFRFPGG